MAKGKICRIKDCIRILKITDGQICQMHRSRFYRHGTYDISPNWPNLKKGQPFLTKNGYIRININGKRVLEHIYIMEQHLGRKLKKEERVHHLNHIRTDNRIENLELFKNNGEHIKKHHKDNWKKRKIHPQYNEDTIYRIILRINHEEKEFDNCFCGGKYEARNLCSKHYQWAYKHKFI